MLQGRPEPFDHAVTAPRAFAVDTDHDLRVCQHIVPSAAGELRALDALLSVKRRSEPD